MMNLNIPGLQIDQPTEDDVRAQLAAQTAPQSSSPYSVGGFLGNIANDAAGMVTSLPGLAQAAYNTTPFSMVPNAIANTIKSGNPLKGIAQAAMAPAETAYNIGKGLVGEAGQLTGIGQNGKVFDPKEALQHAYNHPLNTALDVLPLAKVAELGKMGTAAEAADAAKSTPLADPNSVPSVATNLYGSSFGVTPTEAKYLRPVDTFNEMLLNGFSGGYKDIQAMLDKVTGANGKLPQLVRNATAAIPQAIDVSDIRRGVTQGLNEITGLTDRNVAQHTQNIDQILQTGTSESRAGEHLPAGYLEPMDALDSIQKLQQKAALYQKALPGTPEAALKDLYNNAAFDLVDKLNQAADQSGAIAPQTDQIVQELNNISPRLAQQFQENPTIGKLRSIQAPFVRMSKILDSTLNGSTTRSKQIVNGLNRALLGGIGFGTGGIPGIIASQFLAPVVSAGVDAVLPNAMTKLGVAAANVGNAADAAKTAAMPGLELSRVPSLGTGAAPAAAPTMPAGTVPAFGGGLAVASNPNNPNSTPSFLDASAATTPDQNMQRGPSSTSGLPSIPELEQAMLNAGTPAELERLKAAYTVAAEQQGQYAGIQGGIMATNNAQNIAKQATQMFLGQGGIASGGTGVAMGTLRQLALTMGGKNLDTPAAAYNVWADNASTQIAAALNGGYDKVTAENKKVARDLLPTLTDSPQTAATKLNLVTQYLNAAKQNYYTSTPAQLQQQAQGLPDVSQMLGGQ